MGAGLSWLQYMLSTYLLRRGVTLSALLLIPSSLFGRGPAPIVYSPARPPFVRSEKAGSKPQGSQPWRLSTEAVRHRFCVHDASYNR